jgi:hypothetical protein
MGYVTLFSALGLKAGVNVTAWEIYYYWPCGGDDLLLPA